MTTTHDSHGDHAGHGAHARPAWQKMTPRDPAEPHRPATPLELLFDLCFVVAIAQAASGLHHAMAHGVFAPALVGYCMVFFAIWWAWMNFTWLASAYDTDDVPWRLTVLLQMVGVLILAAGVPRAFDRGDFGVITVGFAVMRVALIVNWLRAARADRVRRRTALRYACGLAVCQTAWVAMAWLPTDTWGKVFWLMLPAELLVPVWAEAAERTTWHAAHIAERYGLLTIIVIGETVLSITLSMQRAIDATALTPDLVGAVVGSVLFMFSMWWLYFEVPAHALLRSFGAAFVWGYGHYAVFAATAAVGAGIAVNIDYQLGAAHISAFQSGAVVGVPVAIYVVTLWLLHFRRLRRDLVMTAASWACAGACIGAAFTAVPVLLIGAAIAALTAAAVWCRRRHRAETAGGKATGAHA
ncbi:MAG: low temperature requirement protein A [Planctomycetota bacterium]